MAGSMPSPNWAAATFDALGNLAPNQKGRHAMTVTKLSGDSAFDEIFPAHPDGARYVVLHSSTEFHTLIQNQTSTSFRFYTRKSSNAGGTEGDGDVSIVIMG